MHQVVDQLGGGDIAALKAIEIHAADLMGAFRKGLGGDEDGIGGRGGRGVRHDRLSLCLSACLYLCLYKEVDFIAGGKKKKAKRGLHNVIAGISQGGIAFMPEAAVMNRRYSMSGLAQIPGPLLLPQAPVQLQPIRARSCQRFAFFDSFFSSSSSSSLHSFLSLLHPPVFYPLYLVFTAVQFVSCRLTGFMECFCNPPSLTQVTPNSGIFHGWTRLHFACSRHVLAGFSLA